jgi:hypothetical protein
MISSNTGVPTFLPNGTTGQVLTATTGSPPSWTTLPTNSPNYTNVNAAASPYTVLSTDDYLSVDTSSGPVTLLFPNAPTARQTWTVKDRTGNAATNNITLTTPGGSVTFDGQTSYKINTSFEALDLIANSTPKYEIY